MKRSKSIRLVLIGSLSAGALAGCKPEPAPVSSNSVYTNNFYVPGAGYYHAPFRAWYPHPYNYFDSQNKRYFFGGQWGTAPHQSITNISPPTPEVVQQVEAQRTDVTRPSVTRGGFGRSSGYHHTWS